MSLIDKKTSIKELSRALACARAEELEVKNGLLIPKDQYIENVMDSIEAIFTTEYEKILDQMREAYHLLQHEIQRLPLLEKDLYNKEITLAREKLRNTMDLQDLADTSYLQQFLGFSDKTLLWIYQVEFNYLEQEKFKEALAIFSLLPLLNPFICDYWIALGFAQKANTLDAEAICSFSFASILNPKNPVSRYRSAELYIKLGRFDDALVELEVLSEIIHTEKLHFLRSNLETLQSKARNRSSIL